MAYIQNTVTGGLATRPDALYQADDLLVFQVRPASACAERPAHTHSQYVFEFVDADCVRLDTAHDSTVVANGQYLLLEPQQHHRHIYCPQTRTLMIYLPQTHVAEVAGEFRAQLHPAIWQASAELVAVLQNIAMETARSRFGQRLLLESLSVQLLVELMRNQQSKTCPVARGTNGALSPEIRRSLDYIHANYTTDVTLDDLAAVAALSRYHFLRLFRTQTGATPHIYIRQVRLEHAAHLLRTSRIPVTEIAGRLGFASPAHLSQSFHQRYGYTPSAYRIEHKSNFL